LLDVSQRQQSTEPLGWTITCPEWEQPPETSQLAAINAVALGTTPTFPDFAGRPAFAYICCLGVPLHVELRAR
jgi:hypothetical protein